MESRARINGKTMELIDEKIKRLHKLLETMDVPEDRKDDLAWLSRNLGIRNRRVLGFAEAMDLIMDIRKVYPYVIGQPFSGTNPVRVIFSPELPALDNMKIVIDTESFVQKVTELQSKPRGWLTCNICLENYPNQIVLNNHKQNHIRSAIASR